MVSCLLDNFINKNECKYLINYYQSNLNKVSKFRDVYPLPLDTNDSELNFLVNKLNDTAKKISNAKIDWFQIVKWPKGSSQDLHFDTASDKTTLSSILYLNEDFNNGETYFEDGTLFKPKTGRVVFFDGNYFKHGVKKVTKGTRFVVATWYKQII